MQQYVVCIFYHTLLHIKIFILLLAKFIYDYLSSLSSNKTYDDETLIRSNFTKLPYHIAFLIIDEEPSYIDLSKLVIWSICFQIYRITLFDPKGSVKKNIDQLKDEIKSYLTSIHTINSHDIHYKILNPLNSEKIPHKNGFSHKIIIYIVDNSDGIKSLNKLCQKFSLWVKEENLRPNNISSDMLVDEMHEICSEPNLAIKFGTADSVGGYMPWHLRFTEIISAPSHKHLGSADFAKYLSRYSRSQQNFGT